MSMCSPWGVVIDMLQSPWVELMWCALWGKVVVHVMSALFATSLISQYFSKWIWNAWSFAHCWLEFVGEFLTCYFIDLWCFVKFQFFCTCVFRSEEYNLVTETWIQGGWIEQHIDGDLGILWCLEELRPRCFHWLDRIRAVRSFCGRVCSKERAN